MRISETGMVKPINKIIYDAFMYSWKHDRNSYKWITIEIINSWEMVIDYGDNSVSVSFINEEWEVRTGTWMCTISNDDTTIIKKMSDYFSDEITKYTNKGDAQKNMQHIDDLERFPLFL